MFQCNGNVTVQSISAQEEVFQIPTVVTSNRSDVPSYKSWPSQDKKGYLKTIKRSNKISEASN